MLIKHIPHKYNIIKYLGKPHSHSHTRAHEIQNILIPKKKIKPLLNITQFLKHQTLEILVTQKFHRNPFTMPHSTTPYYQQTVRFKQYITTSWSMTTWIMGI